jgi:hypothetical protein
MMALDWQSRRAGFPWYGQRKAGEHAMTTCLVLTIFIVSMLVVGHIARSQERRTRPWIWTAALIGPLAIPMLYLVPRRFVGRQ